LLGIISIEKKFPGHPQKVISAVWGGPYAYVKNVIIVDEDVNPHDLNQVLWALSTRFVPDRDLTLCPEHLTSSLDPSQPPSMRGVTVAMGIDATKPLRAYEREGAKFPESCDDPDIKKKVEALWETYGIR
jgi:4-hydroxy-3-polyprenylbenzoate decarboxylase